MGVYQARCIYIIELPFFSLYNNGMVNMTLVVLSSVVFCFGLVYVLYYDDYKDFFKY